MKRKYLIVFILLMVIITCSYLYIREILSLIPFLFSVIGCLYFIILNMTELGSIRRQEIEKILRTADSFYEKKQVQSAIKNFEKALESDPGNYRALIGIAQCYRSMMEYQRALGYLEKAMDLNPDSHHGYYFAGLILLQLNRPNEAIEYLANVEKMNPELEEPCFLLGQIYEKKSDYDNALVYYRKFLSRSRSVPMKDDIAEKISFLEGKVQEIV